MPRSEVSARLLANPPPSVSSCGHPFLAWLRPALTIRPCDRGRQRSPERGWGGGSAGAEPAQRAAQPAHDSPHRRAGGRRPDSPTPAAIAVYLHRFGKLLNQNEFVRGVVKMELTGRRSLEPCGKQTESGERVRDGNGASWALSVSSPRRSRRSAPKPRKPAPELAKRRGEPHARGAAFVLERTPAREGSRWLLR